MKMTRLATALACVLLWFGTPLAAQETSRYVAPSTAAESSRVLCLIPCVLNGFNVNSGASAVWVMLFDATAAPSDGASQTPLKLYQVAANSTLSVGYAGLRTNTGAVLVCSTTGPFTKTATATCTFSGDIR